MASLRATATRPSIGLLLQPFAVRACGSAPVLRRPPSPSLCDQRSAFSTSPRLCKGKKKKGRSGPTRDNNRLRGVSTLYRSGPREPLSVHPAELPTPVPEAQLPPVQTDPDHGLWDFFYHKDRRINTPTEDASHGRAWTVEELRQKGWDDLHRLWWACVKERNRIATGNHEREKGGYGFGRSEAYERDREVRRTMRAIKHTLTERQYAWEDAVELAKSDPEVNLSGEGPAYSPRDYLEPAEEDAAGAEEQAAGEEEQYKEPKAEEAEERKSSTPPAAVDPSTIPAPSKPLGEARRV